MTILLDYFFNIWSFTWMKICPKSQLFTKVVSIIYRIFNKPWKGCQRLSQFYQTGKLLPNLVTLPTSFVDQQWRMIKKWRHLLLETSHVLLTKYWGNLTVWPDGYLDNFAQYLANNNISEWLFCPIALNICQNRFKILQNTN